MSLESRVCLLSFFTELRNDGCLIHVRYRDGIQDFYASVFPVFVAVLFNSQETS